MTRQLRVLVPGCLYEVSVLHAYEFDFAARHFRRERRPPRADLFAAVRAALDHAHVRVPSVVVTAMALLPDRCTLLATPHAEDDLGRFMATFTQQATRLAQRLEPTVSPLWLGPYKAMAVTDEPAAQEGRLRLLVELVHGATLASQTAGHALPWLLEIGGLPLVQPLWADGPRGPVVVPGAAGAVADAPLEVSPFACLPCDRDLPPGVHRLRMRDLVREVERSVSRRVQAGEALALPPKLGWAGRGPVVHAATEAGRARWQQRYDALYAERLADIERYRARVAQASFPRFCFPPPYRPGAGRRGGGRQD